MRRKKGLYESFMQNGGGCADIQRTAHMQRRRQRLISTTEQLICAIGETQKRIFILQSKYSVRKEF